MEQINKNVKRFDKTFPARENHFPCKCENISVRDVVTLITPITITGNDEPDGKRFYLFF